MAIQSDFTPRLHGFDFNNSWDTDENYRQFVRDKIKDALPIIGRTLLTNPLVTAGLISTLGSAYGVGQVLLPGLFDTVVLPILINQVITAVDDKIDDFLPDKYGACGGMAFAALDYYYYRWPIPKGINLDIHNPHFIVPSNDNPEAKVLRDYIYKRHRDTWDSGGVLNKTLEWFILLNTMTEQMGGGGPELQNRTRDEWIKLKGLLDQGKPQPLALIYDTWDIFDNHQLVAHGYAGDPFTGTAFIHIYDNNQPNEEVSVKFDFTGNEMDGRIVQTGNGGFKNNHHLKGFFCAEYTPEQPPVGWGIEQGLWVTPANALSIRENFHIRGVMGNRFRFLQPKPAGPGVVAIDVMLVPLIADAINLKVTPANYLALPGDVAAGNSHPLFEGDISFNQTGDYIMFARVWMKAVDRGTGAAVNDVFGNVLACMMYLPVLGPGVTNKVQLKVLPRLAIVPYNRGNVSCYHPFVEGTDLTLMVEKNPFPGVAGLEYTWEVSAGYQTDKLNQEKLVIKNLPVRGSTFQVSVSVRNPVDGAIANGDREITIYDASVAQQMTRICEMSHILFRFANPRFFDPLGPDNPLFINYLEKNGDEFFKQISRLSELTNAWQKSRHR